MTTFFPGHTMTRYELEHHHVEVGGGVDHVAVVLKVDDQCVVMPEPLSRDVVAFLEDLDPPPTNQPMEMEK